MVNTNTDAVAALYYLNKNQYSITQTIERLSSGLRINHGSDDPSGLGIISLMKARIEGQSQAVNNAQDVISMMQTADSVLGSMNDILLRMNDLAIKAANVATLTSSQIANISTEINSLKSELTRKATAATFNTVTMFSGAFAGGKPVQIGPDNATNSTLNIIVPAMTLSAIGLAGAGTWGANGSMIISNTGATGAFSTAQYAMGYISLAMDTISSARASIGVQETRLNSIINDLEAANINMSAATSRIEDTDMASEISNFARLQVITQANVAMLVQANAMPQQLLNLLPSGK